jgi:hypothetical protein
MTKMNGKPMGRRSRKVRIPIGIEKVLCAAAADPEFCEQLIMARTDALTGSGLELSTSEAMILKAVSEAQLRTMVENIDLKRHKRRRFFRGIAAASLAATTAAIVQGCAMPQSAGVSPSEDIDPGETVENPDSQIPLDSAADEFAPPPDTTVVGSDTVEIDDVNVSAGIPPMDTIDDQVDVQDVEIDDVNVSAGIPPMDVDELDVDVQPVPAGIPPVDVTEE